MSLPQSLAWHPSRNTTDQNGNKENVCFMFVVGMQRWGCPAVFYRRSDRALWHRQTDAGKASRQSTEELERISNINNSANTFLYSRKIKVWTSALERGRG